MQEQIDSTIEDALRRVRADLPQGESLSHCAECGAEIPPARREAVKGVRLCVACQSEHDADRRTVTGYNRRASKGSQLR